MSAKRLLDLRGKILALPSLHQKPDSSQLQFHLSTSDHHFAQTQDAHGMPHSMQGFGDKRRSQSISKDTGSKQDLLLSFV